jgi:hypothetical protein
MNYVTCMGDIMYLTKAGPIEKGADSKQKEL